MYSTCSSRLLIFRLLLHFLKELENNLTVPCLSLQAISLGSLRQVSISKAEHVPTLAAVLPYLELSNNQEYLVKRINGQLLTITDVLS